MGDLPEAALIHDLAAALSLDLRQTLETEQSLALAQSIDPGKCRSHLRMFSDVSNFVPLGWVGDGCRCGTETFSLAASEAASSVKSTAPWVWGPHVPEMLSPSGWRSCRHCQKIRAVGGSEPGRKCFDGWPAKPPPLSKKLHRRESSEALFCQETSLTSGRTTKTRTTEKRKFTAQ